MKKVLTDKELDDLSSEVIDSVEKPNKQKETNMKNSTNKTIITTVIVTLVIVGALVAQALYFYNSGAASQKAQNNQINMEVAHQVTELSKHNQ